MSLLLSVVWEPVIVGCVGVAHVAGLRAFQVRGSFGSAGWWLVGQVKAARMRLQAVRMAWPQRQVALMRSRSCRAERVMRRRRAGHSSGRR